MLNGPNASIRPHLKKGFPMFHRPNILFILLMSIFLTLGCSSTGSNFSYDSLFDVELDAPSPDAEVFAPTDDDSGYTPGGSTSSSSGGDTIDPEVIDDPFDQGDPAGDDHGLAATLFYMNPDPTSAERAQGFGMFAGPYASDSSHEIANKLILSRLNRPTVSWSTGFEYAPGEFISFTNGDGQEEVLVEWFGFIADTKITLTESDPEGDYEFAVLSDDGFTMEVVQNGLPVQVIDSDGEHSTRLGCGTQTIHLEQGEELETRFSYYQGPRYHISFVLLWRSGTDLVDETDCGDAGNSMWFDGDGDSSPTEKYNQLLQRGWSVVPAENYLLPDYVL